MTGAPLGPAAPEAIGVFGGSFDPPHCSHVLLAAYALSVAPIDRLLVVPAFSHAFGKPLQPFEHRVAMCELAFGGLRAVQISRIEETLPPPSYTLYTVQALARTLPGARFRLLVGADVLSDTSRWHKFDELQKIAPLFAVGRSGAARTATSGQDWASTLELPPVSSSDIRARLSRGDPVTNLVPRAVESYIAQHALYRPDPRPG